METVSKRLKYALKQNDMTQVKLAELCDMRNTTISDYIAGRSKPSPDKTEQFAKILNVTPGWLLFGDDKTQIQDVYDQLTPTHQEDVLDYALMKLEKQNKK